MEVRNPLGNGAGILWNSEDSFFYNEIASGDSEEEKVLAAYTWITENMTYDYDFDCFYQYSDTSKTLQTKTGICYDFSCLFAIQSHRPQHSTYVESCVYQRRLV